MNTISSPSIARSFPSILALVTGSLTTLPVRLQRFKFLPPSALLPTFDLGLCVIESLIICPLMIREYPAPHAETEPSLLTCNGHSPYNPQPPPFNFQCRTTPQIVLHHRVVPAGLANYPFFSTFPCVGFCNSKASVPSRPRPSRHSLGLVYRL